jgi:EAL domain-containing protein (putative c-di-GMP-specific phosphodiesterase class I)
MEPPATQSETGPRAASETGMRVTFQPIADTTAGRAHSYEAALFGPHGETLEQIWAELAPEKLSTFDQRAAAGAIRWAISGGLSATTARLVIPSLASAIGDPGEHLLPILQTARLVGLAPERLIFALHGYRDVAGAQLADIVHVYHKFGPATIFVGLGPDQVGLAACGRYQPYAVKLEPELIRGIGASWSRRLGLEALMPRMRSFTLRAIATGVDDEADMNRIPGFGITLIQGHRVGMAAAGTLPPLTLRRAAA